METVCKMNERMIELAEQADLWNDMEPTRREGRYVGYMNVSDVEKFAELIVLECAELCSTLDGGENMFSRGIRKHFGVE